MNVEQLGIRTGRQCAHDLIAGEVEDLHRVIVARADEQRLAVLGQHDATRTLADRHGLLDLERRAVDHADRVALLVRDIDRVGERITREAAQARDGNSDGETLGPWHSWPPYAGALIAGLI